MADLVAHVGAASFQRACDAAWSPVRDAGYGSAPSGESPETTVPHELADLVVGDLDLAIQLYRAMPCYANLMYLQWWAPREELWQHLRALLDESDDRLAAPAVYWLWCGPFEAGDMEAVCAWDAMCRDRTELRTRRLLEASGPVPWSAKAPVLDSLAENPTFHQAIWEAVALSMTDVFGRIDVQAAEQLINRLRSHPDTDFEQQCRTGLRALASGRATS